MAPLTLLWVAPMVFVLVLAFRSFDDIAANGTAAWPASFSLDGFREALGRGDDGPGAVDQRPGDGAGGAAQPAAGVLGRVRAEPVTPSPAAGRSC